MAHLPSMVELKRCAASLSCFTTRDPALDLQLPAVAVSYHSSTSSTTLARRAREMDGHFDTFKHAPPLASPSTSPRPHPTFALYHRHPLSLLSFLATASAAAVSPREAKARQHWCDSTTAKAKRRHTDCPSTNSTLSQPTGQPPPGRSVQDAGLASPAGPRSAVE